MKNEKKEEKLQKRKKKVDEIIHCNRTHFTVRLKED